MSKEKIMIINSRDRIEGTNADFTVTFNDSACQQVKKVLVKDIFIPNLFYNITTANNTLLLFQNIDITPKTVTVPIGQYNVDQLIAQLKTSIDAKLSGGAIVTITKSDILYNLTFTFSGAIVPANNQMVLSIDSTIRDIIGLAQTNSSASVVIMDNPYNLRPLDFVQIHSQQVAETHGLDGGANSYIALLETVSLTMSAFGGIAYRQNSDDELASVLYDQPRNLSRVSIVLRNEQGTRLSLPSNAYVSVMIKIFFD